MNALPSPALKPLPADPAYISYHHSSSHHDSMKALLTSSWHVLEQPPPPTLREILDAYKSKGDGDRDLLMAMLSAKSAEDQRLASAASLHRTMLELYQSPLSSSPILPLPVSLQEPLSHGHKHTHSTQSYTRSHSHTQHFPSPSPSCLHPHHTHPLSHDDFVPSHTHTHSRQRTESSASPTTQPRPAPSSGRKRRRTSRSPPPSRRAAPVPHTHRSVDGNTVTTHETPIPLSPYSSAGSVHSSDSPRSRESMTIGSLLSSQPQAHSHSVNASEKDDHVHAREVVEPKRRISSERSTTTTTTVATLSPRDRRDK